MCIHVNVLTIHNSVDFLCDFKWLMARLTFKDSKLQRKYVGRGSAQKKTICNLCSLTIFVTWD